MKKEIKDAIGFVVFFVFAVALIENEGVSYLAEWAGDTIGAITLLVLGVFIAPDDEPSPKNSDEL